MEEEGESISGVDRGEGIVADEQEDYHEDEGDCSSGEEGEESDEDSDEDDEDDDEEVEEGEVEDDGEVEEGELDENEDEENDEEDEDGDEEESEEEEEEEEDPSQAGEAMETEGASSGDDQTCDRCPICLNRLKQQDIGMPESCDHSFCLECILEWSKNVNTCPVDRQVFHIILAKHAGEEKVYKQIPVENRQQLEEEEAEPVEDDTACEVCGLSDREDRLLLCDSCDAGYHCDCLDPPLDSVPVQEWFCPDCLQQRNREEEPLQRGRQIARTRVSERVRRIIADARAARAERRRIVAQRIANSESFTDEVPLPGPSSSTTRRRGTKRKRTTRRKTTKRRKTTPKKKTTRKRKTTKKRTPGKKPKTRRKRRTKGKSKSPKKTTASSGAASPALARTAQSSATVKGRIADKLGLKPPPRGSSIPVQKSSAAGGSGGSGKYEAAPSFSIMGSKDELYSFAEHEEEERIPVHRPAIPASTLSRSALSSHRPLGVGRIALTRRPVVVSNSSLSVNSSTKAQPAGSGASGTSTSGAQPAQSAPPAPFDLLGSIMSNQDLLHKSGRHITIKRDGSLTAASSGLEIHAASRNINLTKSLPSSKDPAQAAVSDSTSSLVSGDTGQTSGTGDIPSGVTAAPLSPTKQPPPSHRGDGVTHQNYASASTSASTGRLSDNAGDHQSGSFSAAANIPADSGPDMQVCSSSPHKIKVEDSSIKMELIDSSDSHVQNSAEGNTAKPYDEFDNCMPSEDRTLSGAPDNNAQENSLIELEKNLDSRQENRDSLELDIKQEVPDEASFGHHSSSTVHDPGSSNSQSTSSGHHKVKHHHKETHHDQDHHRSSGRGSTAHGWEDDGKRRSTSKEKRHAVSNHINENNTSTLDSIATSPPASPTESSPTQLKEDTAGALERVEKEKVESTPKSSVASCEIVNHNGEVEVKKEICDELAETTDTVCTVNHSAGDTEVKEEIDDSTINNSTLYCNNPATNESEVKKSDSSENNDTGYHEETAPASGSGIVNIAETTRRYPDFGHHRGFGDFNYEDDAGFSEDYAIYEEAGWGEAESAIAERGGVTEWDTYAREDEKDWEEGTPEYDDETWTEKSAAKVEGAKEEGEASDSGEEGELNDDTKPEVKNEDYEEGEIVDEEDDAGKKEIKKELDVKGLSVESDISKPSSFGLPGVTSHELRQVEQGKGVEKDKDGEDMEDGLDSSEEEEEEIEEESSEDDFDPDHPTNGAFMVGKFLESVISNEFDRKKEKSARKEAIRLRKEERARKKEEARRAKENAKISILDFIGNASAKKFGVYAPPPDPKKEKAPAIGYAGRGRVVGARGPLREEEPHPGTNSLYRTRHLRGEWDRAPQSPDRQTMEPKWRDRERAVDFQGGRRARGARDWNVSDQFHHQPTPYHISSRRKRSRSPSDPRSPTGARAHHREKRLLPRQRSKSNSPRPHRKVKRAEKHKRRRRMPEEEQAVENHSGESSNSGSSDEENQAEERNKRLLRHRHKKSKRKWGRLSPEMNGSISSDNEEESGGSGSSDDEENGKEPEIDSDEEVLAKRTSPPRIPLPVSPRKPPSPASPPSPPAYSPVGPVSPAEPPPPPPSPPKTKQHPRPSQKPQVQQQLSHHQQQQISQYQSHPNPQTHQQAQHYSYPGSQQHAQSRPQQHPQPHHNPHSQYPQHYQHQSQHYPPQNTHSQHPVHSQHYSHPYSQHSQHPQYSHRPAQSSQYSYSHHHPAAAAASSAYPRAQAPRATAAAATGHSAYPYYSSQPAATSSHTQSTAASYQQGATARSAYQQYSYQYTHPGYSMRHPYPPATSGSSSAAAAAAQAYPYSQQGVYQGAPRAATAATAARAAHPYSGYSTHSSMQPSHPGVTGKSVGRVSSPPSEAARPRVSSYRISPSEPSFKGVPTSDRIASNLLLDEVKKGFRQLVEDAVRTALKSAWSAKKVTKDEYKDIFKRAVDKVCGSKETVVQQDKIQLLVEAYVARSRKARPS